MAWKSGLLARLLALSATFLVASASPFHYVFVGRTGDGKSTLSIALARHLGGTDTAMFRESAGLTSVHHHTVDTCVVGDTSVHDTPGLMDSGGVAQDEANIALIVNHLRAVRSVNAFFLVVNEQAPRFDDGMQAAVNLLVDSFGPALLNNLGIVFTRPDGGVTPADSRAKAAEIAAMISARTGVPLSHLPSWQVQCHPERFEGRMLPDAIAALRTTSSQALGDMVRWGKNRTPVDTSDAVIGEYVERRARREAEESEAVQKKARENEEAARRVAEAHAAAAEARAREAEARARKAESRQTFFSLTKGFKIDGVRHW